MQPQIENRFDILQEEPEGKEEVTMHKEQQRMSKTTEKRDENPKHSEGVP